MGLAGLAAAMAVCSVSELAVKFLCFTSDNGRSMAGVSALRQALSIEEAPPGISRFVLGVLEVLTLSTGGLGCACLLGLVAPKIREQPKSEGEGCTGYRYMFFAFHAPCQSVKNPVFRPSLHPCVFACTTLKVRGALGSAVLAGSGAKRNMQCFSLVFLLNRN